MHLIELVNNVTLLLALSMIYILLIKKVELDSKACSIFLGTLFGIFTIFGMLNPVNFLPGIFFDGRSILLSAGAFIGGPLAATISAAIAGIFRFYIGGEGRWVGVLVVLTSSVIGVIAHRYRAKKVSRVTTFELYIFGLLVHVTMILCMLALPGNSSTQVLRNMALPILIIFPIGTFILTMALIELKKNLMIEKELEESHKFYLSIIDNCKTIIYATDLEGNFILANAELLKTLKRNREDVIGCPRKHLFSPDEVEKQELNDQKVIKAEDSILVEEKCIFGDKASSHISVKFPLKDDKGRITAIGAISTDVSEWKEAQEELDRTRKLFATAFDFAPIGMAIVKLDGVIHKANKIFCKILEYSEADILKMNFRDFTHPDDMGSSLENVKKMLNGDYARFSMEKKYVSRSGQTIHSHTSASVLRNDLGEPQYFFVQIIDITQRKILQERLQQSQKLESLGNLAGGIAHDFNNILASIVGFSELVKQDLSESHPAFPSIEAVLKSSSRAKELVKRILLFARKTEEIKQPLDLARQIKETLAMLRPTIPSSIAIDCSAEERITIFSNPSQINQILINLITNASHAIGSDVGRISITLTRAESKEVNELEHLKLKFGKYVKLVVKDSGKGIPEEIQKKIFEPYYSTKTPESGTGLGLSVVHGLVAEARGSIFVESAPGSGTSFILYFPEYADEQLEHKPEKTLALCGTEHIILIDDEDMIITSFSLILQSFGYQVSSFHDPEEALEAFAKSPDSFDLVISDMTMPKITGDILAQKMLNIRKDIPIIICTGFSQKLTEEKATEIGIEKLIFKPLTGVDLSVAVREVLDSRKKTGETEKSTQI